MYNLLVSANENDWRGEPFVLARSRCLSEHTDREIVTRFHAMNAEHVRELCALPCVFAYEAQCAKNPKFGVLLSVKPRGPLKMRIEYSILPCEPFLTAEDLKSMGSLLDIRGFEMNRTHWAVKDVDLAGELARRQIELPGWVTGSGSSVDIERHQFDVALSFPGEHREYVNSVAEELRRILGPDACFYDRFYEAQLARPNLDVLLQDIYGKRSGLVVVFVCAEYEEKMWCGIEWRRIRERGALGADREIMYVRLGDGKVAGITRLDGYLDGSARMPEEVAGMIVQRVKPGGSALEDAAHATGWPAGSAKTAHPSAPRSADLAISGTVTDAMRQRFVTAAFDYIASYVENSAMALHSEHGGSVEAIATRIDAMSFEATLFVGGKRRSHCGIWLSTGGQAGLGTGVYYSNQGVGNRNGFNEMLTVVDDGREVFLRAMFGGGTGRIKDRLTKEGAAEYLWQKLKQPLA